MTLLTKVVPSDDWAEEDGGAGLFYFRHRQGYAKTPRNSIGSWCC
jgi:hypothetical protein